MELKSALEKLQVSKEFKSWNIKNKDIYFSYALVMPNNLEIVSWQLGYYHKLTDKITTFIVNEKNIELQTEEDIFKKSEMEVRPLDVTKIKISLNKIMEIVGKFQKSEYPNELVNKTIVILQNLADCGNIWNITYIMHSFKTLNIKVNIENGEVISHNLVSIMDFVDNKT